MFFVRKTVFVCDTMAAMLDERDKLRSIIENDTVTYLKEQGVTLNDE